MEEYKEIDLRQFLLVLKKRKKFILIIFLAVFLFSAVYAKYSPISYNIYSSLEIGQIENNLIENPIQLATKVDKGIFGDYNLKAVPVSQTNIVDISIATLENPEKAREFLNDANAKIIENHDALIKIKNQKVEKMIETLQKEADYLISKSQQVAAIRLQIVGLQAKREEGNFSTKIIAEPKVQKKYPNYILILFSGATLGLFLGILAVFTKEQFQDNKQA